MNINIDDLIQRTSIILLQNNFNLSNKKIRSALGDFIGQAFEHFRSNPPFPLIEEIEKRAITHVITLARASGGGSGGSGGGSGSGAKMDLPLPEIDVKDNDEQSFFKKLENMEIMRKIQPDKSQIPSLPIFEPQAQESFKPQLPPQVVAAPTIVYIPTKTKISDLKQIIINSIDRKWDYNPKRSIFIWSGNISNDENIRLAFAGIFLPKIVATISPVIILEIEGAGGSKQNILCSLNSEGPFWDKWFVIRTTDSKDTTIRQLASPWTIKLYDVYNNLIELGEDAYIIKNVDILLNGNASMELEVPSDDLKDNNIFIIKKNDKITGKYKVLSKLNNFYQIRCIETTNITDFYNNLVGGIICNISAQVTMIIETAKNELQVGTAKNELQVGTAKNELQVGTAKNELQVGTAKNELQVSTLSKTN